MDGLFLMMDVGELKRSDSKSSITHSFKDIKDKQSRNNKIYNNTNNIKSCINAYSTIRTSSILPEADLMNLDHNNMINSSSQEQFAKNNTKNTVQDYQLYEDD